VGAVRAALVVRPRLPGRAGGESTRAAIVGGRRDSEPVRSPRRAAPLWSVAAGRGSSRRPARRRWRHVRRPILGPLREDRRARRRTGRLPRL